MPKINMEKIVAGALLFKEKRLGVEWFLVKSENNGKLEIPKSDVRRGESSVSAAIRFIKESAGFRVTVLEEAGRMNMTGKIGGQGVDMKVFVYLMRLGSGDGRSEFAPTVSGEWHKYANARRKLERAREQKVLSQASLVLKQWEKDKGKRATN